MVNLSRLALIAASLQTHPRSLYALSWFLLAKN